MYWRVFSSKLLYGVKKRSRSTCVIYIDQMCLLIQEIHWIGRNICVQPPLGLHKCRVLKFIFFNYLMLPSGTAPLGYCFGSPFFFFLMCVWKNIFNRSTCWNPPKKCLTNVPIEKILNFFFSNFLPVTFFFLFFSVRHYCSFSYT